MANEITAKDIIEYLHRFESKDLAQELLKEHLTNQQSVIRNIFSMLKIYAENAATDLRNEEAVKWAKKITEKPVHFPYI